MIGWDGANGIGHPKDIPYHGTIPLNPIPYQQWYGIEGRDLVPSHIFPIAT